MRSPVQSWVALQREGSYESNCLFCFRPVRGFVRMRRGRNKKHCGIAVAFSLGNRQSGRFRNAPFAVSSGGGWYGDIRKHVRQEEDKSFGLSETLLKNPDKKITKNNIVFCFCKFRVSGICRRVFSVIKAK